jgi:glycine reductase
MDLHHQEEIKRLADQHGTENLMILLGAPDPESAALSAETVTMGDPTFAGPLTEVQLGLDVYHVLEDEIRRSVPEAVWEEQIGIMSDVLDAEGISRAVREIREKATAGR